MGLLAVKYTAPGAMLSGTLNWSSRYSTMELPPSRLLGRLGIVSVNRTVELAEVLEEAMVGTPGSAGGAGGAGGSLPVGGVPPEPGGGGGGGGACAEEIPGNAVNATKAASMPTTANIIASDTGQLCFLVLPFICCNLLSEIVLLTARPDVGRLWDALAAPGSPFGV